MKTSDTVTMWTAQAPVALAAMEEDGVSYVKKEYIKKKYGDAAWIFETAYGYFRRKMEECISRPEEAESPVWIFSDPKWSGLEEGALLLKLEIPGEEIVFFDRKKWAKILSLSYIGTDEEEEAFARELERQGIVHSSDVFRSSFYPVMKNKIVKSWDSLFDIEGLGRSDLQGAVWQLKREWLA